VARCSAASGRRACQAERINETRSAINGTATSSTLPDVEEQNESLYGRVKFRLGSDVAVIVGGRGDHWKSTSTANFFSPRATVTWRASDVASLQLSVARSYRTPTLNELYRGFRVGNVVTNPNPLLEPERLTGVEGGVLLGHGRASVRVTGFHNVLQNAISNITIATTPAQVNRPNQRPDDWLAAHRARGDSRVSAIRQLSAISYQLRFTVP